MASDELIRELRRHIKEMRRVQKATLHEHCESVPNTLKFSVLDRVVNAL